MFDYHMHSNFSADCSVKMEDMVNGAISKGLTEICFTEHIDYEYPDKNFIFEFNLDEYDKKVKQLQHKYQDQIKIRKGVEIGVQPHLLDRYKTLMDQETFDFVICSMHTTDKKGLHAGDLFTDRTIDEAYRIYYDELLYCVKNFKQYNILGHLDLVKRYTIDNPSTHHFREIISEIFKVIIPDGKGIELNTSGTRYGLPSGMPSKDILELYRQYGGELITLGSDAHRESELAYEFKESLILLQSIGFKEIATFSQQEPTYHSISALLHP
ncbi:MAG TPA: histidinol-phosphatase HisJ family protein [Virgibacillus sp.]|nr:histidinol-phosphatase HisJ family protein [Virgibacillus sp.]